MDSYLELTNLVIKNIVLSTNKPELFNLLWGQSGLFQLMTINYWITKTLYNHILKVLEQVLGYEVQYFVYLFSIFVLWRGKIISGLVTSQHKLTASNVKLFPDMSEILSGKTRQPPSATLYVVEYCKF